jgi:hypothetical protein
LTKGIFLYLLFGKNNTSLRETKKQKNEGETKKKQNNGEVVL